MSSNEINVSVIIPCHNVSEYIEECLESAFTQTYEFIEVIAIDNNSGDNTYAILEQLKQSKYPELQLLKEHKKGACAARNRGLAAAKGKWIQFLDADDLIYSNKIEHQIGLVEDQTGLAYVAGAYFSQDSNGENTRSISVGTNHEFVNVFVREAGNTCSNLFSKEWVNKVNGWNEDLNSSQETDLMMRILLAGGKFISDQKKLTVIRERISGQISQSNPTLRWENIVKHRMQYKKEIEKYHPEVYSNIQDEICSFIVSSVIILSQFDKSLALLYARQMRGTKYKLVEKYGLQSRTILIIKLVGLERFLKLKNRLKR